MAEAPVWTYRVIKEYPHAEDAFCQGLVFHHGALYEGTGLHGQSSLRKVELETGKVLEKVRLDDRLFGEGIAILGDRIYQLTWQNRLGLIFDLKTLEYQDKFSYAGEGWGLTTDGTHLIASDGSSTLRFFDPRTFKVVKTLNVRDGRRRVVNLNELEYVDGQILANVYQTNRIAVISAKTGLVTAWLDLSGLRPKSTWLNADAVLNGIAYDAEGKRLFVTGKLWPKLFHIQVHRK
jgi:glutaminyl-peptide cyclotransferase